MRNFIGKVTNRALAAENAHKPAARKFNGEVWKKLRRAELV
jgi:hypothetical protein